MTEPPRWIEDAERHQAEEHVRQMTEEPIFAAVDSPRAAARAAEPGRKLRRAS